MTTATLTTHCDQCRGPLWACDVLSGLTTCCECARRALHAMRKGTRPVTVTDEWAIFRHALVSAACEDGTIHQRDVRPLIRGKVAPKSIGTYYRRAKAEGLIADTGEREPSTDVLGKNADKLSRVYRLGGAR